MKVLSWRHNLPWCHPSYVLGVLLTTTKKIAILHLADDILCCCSPSNNLCATPCIDGAPGWQRVISVLKRLVVLTQLLDDVCIRQQLHRGRAEEQLQEKDADLECQPPQMHFLYTDVHSSVVSDIAICIQGLSGPFLMIFICYDEPPSNLTQSIINTIHLLLYASRTLPSHFSRWDGHWYFRERLEP